MMRLVTWNIQWCLGCDGQVDPKRIIEHARAFADFDVLCLQEVAANFPGLRGSSGEDQFEELARLLPGFEAVSGVAVDLPDETGGRRRFGNLILSRLPVRRILRHQLPWPPDPNGKPGMSRQLLVAVLRSPFGDLRVMTTHLEYHSALQRAAQVQAIRGVHEQSCARAAFNVEPGHDHSATPFSYSSLPATAILTGDFNFRPGDPLHEQMQAPLGGAALSLHDSWSVAHPGVVHQDTNGVYDRKQWPSPFTCDYIYVTTDLVPRIRQVRVDADTKASDHQPVLIELG